MISQLTRQFSFGYIALCLLALSGLGWKIWGDVDLIFQVAKPLPILALVLYYVRIRRQGGWSWEDGIIVLGLISALVADALLLDQSGNRFMWALLAYMVTHLCYGWAFLRQGTRYLRSRWWLWVLVLTYALAFIFFLYPQNSAGLPAYTFWAIVGYVVTLSIMALTALNRRGGVPDRSFQWVLLGTMLLVLSDSLTGINRFVMELPTKGMFLLTVYYAAQYFIVVGYENSREAEIA